MIIAFDVDGTLITQDKEGRDTPNYDVINIFRWFKSQGHEMVIWSGGGEDYAEMWGKKLGLAARCVDKHALTVKPDLTFDDQDVTLGWLNVRVVS